MQKGIIDAAMHRLCFFI